MSAVDYSGELRPSSMQSQPEPGVYPLVFDYRRPPISANSRFSHWSVKAKLVKDVRLASKLLAARIPHMGRVRVDLLWVVADRRARDGGENLAPTLKPMIDGLVDAGVVDDDDQAHVTRGTSLVEYRKGATPHMVLTVREVAR